MEFKKESSTPPLFISLAKVISGEIESSPETLAAYSNDGSPYSVLPQVIVYPKTVKDIKHCISFARDYSIPLTPRGAGTASTGGCLGEGIIIDMTRYFNTISHVDIQENTITVDAGVSIEDLQEKAALWGMEIPLFGNTGDTGTVGGAFATRSITSSSFYYGSIREWVEGLTIVLDTGEQHTIRDGITPSGRLLGIYQTVFPFISSQKDYLRAAKRENSDDSTGYNIWGTSIGPRQLLDQLAGSEGTLGIITSLTFRMVQKKQHSITTALPITEVRLLTSCIEIAKHHGVEKIYLYDKTYASLVNKFHHGLLPERNEESLYTLLVTHKGNDLHKLQMTISTFLRAIPIKKEDIFHTEDVVTATLESSDFLTKLFTVYTRGSQLLIKSCQGLIVPLAKYATALHEIDIFLATTGRLYVLTGNAGSGHISIITLFSPEDYIDDSSLHEYISSIVNIIQKYSGGISAYGGDGITSTPYLSKFYNETVLDIFASVKTIWDPSALFNPGKKTSLSTKYAKEHTVLHQPVSPLLWE